MMTFESFKEMVEESILEYLPEEYAGANINVDEVKKASMVYTGLTVRKPSTNVAPIINLDMIYMAYKGGKASVNEVLEEIASQIIEGYKNAVNFNDISIKFDDVKDKIVFSLVSYETGRQLFSSRPYIIFQKDIVVIFKICLDSSNVTIPITNNIFNSWGRSVDELFTIAINNIAKIMPMRMDSMADIMLQMMGRDLIDGINPEMLLESPLQYVVSTENKLDGAVTLLMPSRLEEIRNRIKDDFYILPSSIHELIIMPVSSTPTSADELNQMVREVNATEVAPDEVLTNHVFLYEGQQLKCC